MSYQYIEVTQEGRIATVILNRPEVSNAFHTVSYQEVADAMDRFSADPTVGAVVITGRGKHFSAGGDLLSFRDRIETGEYLTEAKITAAGRMALQIRRCSKPTIAMINGAAAGAGASAALACDFRIVQPSSKMILAFVNMGLSGDTLAMFHLMKLIGIDQAELMLMTGEPVKGEECLKKGLATILAEEGKLAEETYALAKKLADKSSAAIASQKRLINEFYYEGMETFLAKEAVEMSACSRKPDFTEAVYAFLEKRRPVFNKGIDDGAQN